MGKECAKEVVVLDYVGTAPRSDMKTSNGVKGGAESRKGVRCE